MIEASKKGINFPQKPIRSENIKNLIRKMLKFEENDRVSIPELLEDEIMYNNIIVKGNYILLDII